MIKAGLAQIYYYDPQSAGINMQSPQSESIPRRLTLLKFLKFSKNRPYFCRLIPKSNPTYGSNKNWKARDFYAAGSIHAYCHFPNAFWYQICICHHSGNIELWLLSTLIGHCKTNQKRIWNRYAHYLFTIMNHQRISTF